MAGADPDAATAEAILRLQLEDVDDALEELYEELTEAESSAFKVMRDDISAAIRELEDCRIATALSRVDHVGREILERACEEERQAVRDHELACRLAGVRVTPEHRAASERLLGETASVLSVIDAYQVQHAERFETAPPSTQCVVFEDTAEESKVEQREERRGKTIEEKAGKKIEIKSEKKCEKQVEENSSPVIKKVGENKTARNPESKNKQNTGIVVVKKVDERVRDQRDKKSEESNKGEGEKNIPATASCTCIACADVKPAAGCLLLGCRPEPHAYCPDCVVKLFEASMSDTTLFPPRCCREPIPLDSAKAFMAADFIKTFEEKSLEYSTPNPIYCCRPECSHFIPPSRVKASTASCPACAVNTCTHCKKAGHKGVCSKDPSIEQLLGVAKERHWQRCYNCHAMVELVHGCNHIKYVPLPQGTAQL